MPTKGNKTLSEIEKSIILMNSSRKEKDTIEKPIVNMATTPNKIKINSEVTLPPVIPFFKISTESSEKFILPHFLSNKP